MDLCNRSYLSRFRVLLATTSQLRSILLPSDGARFVRIDGLSLALA